VVRAAGARRSRLAQGRGARRNTEASGHADAAFLAASTMVALGTADPSRATLYELHRVRGVVEPSVPLGRELGRCCRHKDDTVELASDGARRAAVHAVAPMTLAMRSRSSTQLGDDELPAPFAQVRARCATWLGGRCRPCNARVSSARDSMSSRRARPLLVAGDERAADARASDLVFRLARAMTFLWPGRAIGASRRPRAARVVMAIFREASMSEIAPTIRSRRRRRRRSPS